MKEYIRIIIFFFILLMGLSACENFEEEMEYQVEGEQLEYLQGSLMAQLLDDAGERETHVDLSLSQGNFSTGKFGFTYLENEKWNARGVAVEQASTGLIYSFFPALDTDAYAIGRSQKNARSSWVNVEEDWKALINQSIEISSGNAVFEGPAGMAASGSIQLKYWQTALEEIEDWQSFPSSMPAEARGNKAKRLIFNTVFSLHFFSQAEERLTLKKGTTVRLRNQELLQQLNTASLWYYNADRGTWIEQIPEMENEDVFLNKTGYWAIGRAENEHLAVGELSLNGVPAMNRLLALHVQNRIVQTTRTARDGSFRMYVPEVADAQLMLINEPVGNHHSWQINNGIQDFTNLGVLELNDEKAVLMQGEIKTCDNELAEMAYLLVEDGYNEYILPVAPQEFQVELLKPEGVELYTSALDINTGEQGPKIKWQASANNKIEMFPLYSCQKAQGEYITLDLEGDYLTFWNGEMNQVNGRTVLQNEVGSSDYVRLFLKDLQAGELPDTALNFEFELSSIGDGGYALSCADSPVGCGFEKFVITQTGNEDGPWVRGFFSGTFWLKKLPNRAVYRDIKGSFQVER